jgi:hypothetical protein
MLRSLLLGVLALSTASACKGSSDAPTAQPGVAVGKVVEISGDVSATRGTAKRALASGQEISGDDVIETGARANVRILFAHNNATWDLGPNKKQLVSESLAWRAPKADSPAGDVNEATLAAGRHAERETVTTGTTAPAPAAQAAAAPGASGEPSSDALVASDKRAEPAKPSRKRSLGPANEKGGGGGMKEKASIERDERDDDARADERMPATTTPRGGGATLDTARPPSPITAPKDSPPPPPPPPPPANLAQTNVTEEVRGVVGKQRTELAKCMDTATLSIGVIVAKGKATFTFPAGTSDKAKSCFSAIAAKLSFPADYDVKTTMSFSK